MTLTMKKIVRHKWFPFIVKHIVVDVDGVEYLLCNGWGLDFKDAKKVTPVNQSDEKLMK